MGTCFQTFKPFIDHQILFIMESQSEFFPWALLQYPDVDRDVSFTIRLDRPCKMSLGDTFAC